MTVSKQVGRKGLNPILRQTYVFELDTAHEHIGVESFYLIVAEVDLGQVHAVLEDASVQFLDQVVVEVGLA